MNIWLHLGMGSFHRAHQACYFNELLKQGVTDWAITAGNIRDDAERTVQGMLAQHNEYTLQTVSPDGQSQFETIRSIKKVIPYVKGLQPLIEAGIDPQTKVVAFTVTEAGYYLDAALHLQQDNPFVKADLYEDGVNTVYAVTARILEGRMVKGSGPVTLLSCDNVRENGEKFEHGLREFLQLRGKTEVLEFMNKHVTCPNTMVDRITPRPAADLAEQIKAATGIEDKAPVMSESFIQWVVEDRFAAGRPPLEKVGVQMVSSVVPFEDAKLRILNASHSLLAFGGVFRGHSYVYECARDPQLYQLAYNYVTDCVIPCIQGNGIDLEDYRDTVLNRFKNDRIRDTLQRICQDSFSKMISFVQPTLFNCFEQHRDPAGVALILGLYLRFLQAYTQGKVPFEYQDSSYDPAWGKSVCEAADPVKAFAATKLLFGKLAGTRELEQALADAYQQACNIAPEK